jgi:hypothetical protein
MNQVTIDTQAPAADAWDEYDRSLERLLMIGEPIDERVRAAFRAGYDAGRRAAESVLS